MENHKYNKNSWANEIIGLLERYFYAISCGETKEFPHAPVTRALVRTLANCHILPLGIRC